MERPNPTHEPQHPPGVRLGLVVGFTLAAALAMMPFVTIGASVA